MRRQSDPESPAAAAVLTPGDCVADVGAEALEDVAAYHDYAEPPDTRVNREELV